MRVKEKAWIAVFNIVQSAIMVEAIYIVLDIYPLQNNITLIDANFFGDDTALCF